MQRLAYMMADLVLTAQRLGVSVSMCKSKRSQGADKEVVKSDAMHSPPRVQNVIATLGKISKVTVGD